MKENLYYLFLSGLILGSGPCLAFCAPILVSYTAIHKKTFKDSFFSYLVFSLCKLLSYAVLGLLCALGVKIINTPLGAKYLDSIYLGLGYFIVLIGVATIFHKGKKLTSICSWLNKGNIKNVGILGLLIGFTPCLPLLGILNYIIIISKNIPQSIIFSLVFGLGTVISPLFILVLISGKLVDQFSKNNIFKAVIRIVCGLILLLLGGRIILQILLR